MLEWMPLFFVLASPGPWLVLGIVLVVLELILPGLVSVFLGVGALMTSAALSWQWIDTPAQALSTFFVASIGLLLFVRAWIGRFFPSTKIISETDEVQLALRQRVPVVEAIAPGGEGRISFLGTTWKARFSAGSKETAEIGAEVQILGQDNITYIVGFDPAENAQKKQTNGDFHS
jgi:membrane protein implicated in regulation of membrane protease activity